MGTKRATRRILAGLALCLAGQAALLLQAAPARAEPTSEEAQFVVRVNALRASKGLAPLAVDPQLRDIARTWSAQMAAAGGISHNPALADQVSNWQKIGENVGVGGDVTTIENAFEASPHHYANLVDPAFTYVGIGVVDANGSIWVTQDFKRPAQTAAVPALSANPTPSGSGPQASPRPASAPRSTATPRPAAAAGAASGAPASTAAAPPTAAPAGAPPTPPSPTPTVLGVTRPRLPAASRAMALTDRTVAPVALVLFGLVAVGVARFARRSPGGGGPVSGSVA